MVSSEIICVIRCKPVEILRKLEESTKKQIDLDNTIVRTWQSFPRGVERRDAKSYRLRDYFDSIELLYDGADDPLSLKLVFHPKEDTDWKALLMAVLRSVTEGLSGVSVTSLTQV